MTPYPDSNKIVLRQQAAVQWGKDDERKPWVTGKVINKWLVNDIRKHNKQIELFVDMAASDFTNGSQIRDLIGTLIPKSMEPVSTETILKTYIDYVGYKIGRE